MSRGVAGHSSVTGATGRAVVRGDVRGAAHGPASVTGASGRAVVRGDVRGVAHGPPSALGPAARHQPVSRQPRKVATWVRAEGRGDGRRSGLRASASAPPATRRMRRPACGYAAPTSAVATAMACQRQAGETDLRDVSGRSSSDEVEESDDREPGRREVSVVAPRSPPTTVDAADSVAARQEGGGGGEGGDIPANRPTLRT